MKDIKHLSKTNVYSLVVTFILLVFVSIYFIFQGKHEISIALLVFSFSLIIFLFKSFFSKYEIIWFVTTILLSCVVSVIFPEESTNGVNGYIISFLYLLDTYLNVMCELLISKQSRYNFLVSLGVEAVEIAICIVLMYRFSTMAVTIFFWIPIDIISFINWSKHKDKEDEDLTVVKRLTGLQELLVIVGIAVWTIVVGYIISGLNIATDFLNGNKELETIVIYLDACVSAIGVANGVFILLRLREQWIAWYLCSILETIINIISGQYVLLVLKAAYLTNTTYGLIKWNKYIKNHNDNDV